MHAVAQKVVISTLAASLTLGLSSCSEAHDFLNPPKFTAPVATPSISGTPLPSYITPGSEITEFELHGKVPRSRAFVARSLGFTLRLSCDGDSATKAKITVFISGTKQSATVTCSKNPKVGLALALPEASDSEGQAVRMTVQLLGSEMVTGRGVVTNGTSS